MDGGSMSRATTNIKIEFSATMTLNETECRALDALIGYGVDAFLKVFKQHMGEAYLRGHEAGVASLFETVGKTVHPALTDINQLRNDIERAARNRSSANLVAAVTE
jgi:hypothetical protein